MGGEQTFVLSTSGHVAALINPPGNPKARYRTGRPYPPNAAEWLEQASTNEGSWWPEFSDWLAERGGGERPAPPELGNDEFPPICPAPGSYVRAG
jgi:poly(3-hydroxyalkanoate) synthetase